MTLEAFHQLATQRRATRHFRQDAIPEGVIEQLLESAHWAPSGYNLQPTHFVVVTDAAIKQALHPACLSQRQILDAPAVVVFAGDRHVVAHHFDDVLTSDREAGALTPQYEQKLREVVPLAFDQGPWGLGWLAKALLAPVMRCVKPMPSIPAVQKRYWLTKQVMLSAMTFMLASQAAGLSTSPMEGFDEGRVRKTLRIPSTYIVPVVIAVGYGVDEPLVKTRLPLSRLLHREGF